MIQEIIKINSVEPEIDGGRYPVKTEIDVSLDVYANITADIPLRVWLMYKKQDNLKWERIIMKKICENKWKAKINFENIGIYEYTVEAIAVKNKNIRQTYNNTNTVIVEPKTARFSSWYEMFHRSQGKIPGKSATFKDMEERLPEIKNMGFDVLYLVPIHPIGKINRKGPNNSLIAGPNDPGSPWAVQNHKEVNPELGTLDDFRNFVKKANEIGMEIALDIVFTCSPDHPYIKKHPDWFFYNTDGTLKYAENPPKKYEDVCPLNFNPKNKEKMWNEMKGIIEFWIQHGVKIFRIDNPHTKPTEFWEWLIKEIKKKYPEVIFLSEAFVYYEKLEELAKIGFSQSYSYFTWRNTKNELIEYFYKLTNSYLKYFLRVNLFTNTPDILPFYLQTGGRPAFMIRAVLAATLSSIYGIYNGFELCENTAIPGKEEYLNSEKYEYKVWDWNRPGNIKDFITKINKIRQENTALHYYDNLRFYNSTNEHIIFYGKTSKDKKNIILVAVNLDPFNTQTSRVTVPLEEWGIKSDAEYNIIDLLTDEIYKWKGRENIVILDPNKQPAHIFKLEL